MKIAVFLALVIILILLYPSSLDSVSEPSGISLISRAYSVGDDAAAEELDRIFEEFSKLLPSGIEDAEGALGEDMPEYVFDMIGALIGEGASRASSFLLMLIGMSLIFALAELSSLESADTGSAVKSGVSICLTVPVLSFSRELIAYVGEGIASGSAFFSGAVPLLSSVLAMGGGTASAGAAAMGMSLSLSFVSGILSSALFPICTLIFCISMISAYDSSGGAARVGRSVRNLFSFIMGAVTVVLLGTVALQSVIASSRDSVALRGARYAISGMVPVVGGTLSGALSALISGSQIMSSSMGVLSVIALVACMGAPLITLLIYRLCTELCVTFCELCGASQGKAFLESFRNAEDALLSVLGSSVVIYVFQIIIFMKASGLQ